MDNKIETIFFSQKLKMEEPECTICVAEKKKLYPIIEPKEASARPVRWKIHQNEIATIDSDGVLEGVSVGKTVVYAKCDYGIDRCIVNVIKGEQEICTDDCYDLQREIGMFQMNIRQKGDGRLVFQSDHDDIVSVSEHGCLQLHRVGEARITISASETEQYRSCTRTVPICVKESGLPEFCISDIRNKTEGIQVQWTKVPGADGYYIYRESEDGVRVKINTVGSTQNKMIMDTDVVDGKFYRYFLKAYNDRQFSPEIGAKDKICRLSMVELDKVIEKKGQILLEWKEIQGVLGYLIYRKAGTSEWSVLSKVLGSSNTVYFDKEIILNENYTYSVAAFSGRQLGTLDIVGKSIIYTGIPQLDKVNNVRIGGRARDALRINWDKNEEAEGYVIQQKKQGKWVRIARIPNANTLTYRVEKLLPGKQYYFRVRAFAFYGKKQYNSEFVNLSGITLKA